MSQSNVVVTGPNAIEGTYKNIVLKSGIGFEEQTRKGYCIYHVKWNYDLGGAVVDIPANVVISMEGGVISNGTLVGHDTQIIYDVPVDKAFVNVELEGTWIDDDDKQDARITELERISGNRAESTVLPTHMGRITLKPNIAKRSNYWFVYPYTYTKYGHEITDNILVYFNDNKYYLPRRYADTTPVALTVAAQDNVGEIAFSAGANIEDVATALNLQSGQYLSYDDRTKVITMPDSSTVDAWELVNDNWPFKNYTETDANLLTQQMISKPNTIYVIQYDYELATNITVPANCVLEFDGGSISGTSTLNLNNAKIKGCGLLCNCTSPFGNMLETTNVGIFGLNAENDRIKFQRLIDANINITICSNITFSDEIHITHAVSIIGKENYTLSFPNSKGFVWNTTGYFQLGIIRNININSKGHCFDFYNEGSDRPNNIYHYLFKNIKVTSTEGCGFYAGTSIGAGSDQIIFSCHFEDIWISNIAQSGFYGIRSICNSFNHIIAWVCGVAVIQNCAGYFTNCNGVSPQTPHWAVFTQSNTSWILMFKNCNFESCGEEIIKNTTNSGILSLSFENCSLYPAYNSETGKITKFPLDLGPIRNLEWKNVSVFLNGHSYDSGICLIRYIKATENHPQIISDSELFASVSNRIFKVSGGSTKYMSVMANADWSNPKIFNYFNFLATDILNFKGISFNETSYKANVEYLKFDDGYVPTVFKLYVDTADDVVGTDTMIKGITTYESYIGKAVFWIVNTCVNRSITIEHKSSYYITKFVCENGNNIVLKPKESVFVEGFSTSDGSKNIFFVHNKVGLPNKKVGSTQNRPTLDATNEGFQYFDKTLNKPIYWTGSGWVDATGTQV